MDSVVSYEIESVAYYGEISDRTAATSAVDILDHHRARGGSIALPQFGSMDSVISWEIESVAHYGEIRDRTAATSAVDILDDYGS